MAEKIVQTAGRAQHASEMVFPIGGPNPVGQYFIGNSYLEPITEKQVTVFNVTFEPGCRNNWHVHHADKGGGQILICVAGRGWYQEWGKEPVDDEQYSNIEKIRNE